LTTISGNVVRRHPSLGSSRRDHVGFHGAVVDQDRLALAFVCLGVCALPVLLPSGPGNLTPSDALILTAIGAGLLWAATTQLRLSMPYKLGVGTMAAAGMIAGMAGQWPGLALLSVMQDLFLLAWAAVLASLLRTSAAAVDVVLRVWTYSAAAWAAAFVAGTTRTAVTAGAHATRAGFTFGDQNGAGLYFVLSFAVMIAAGRPRSRLARAALGSLFLVATLYTGSLGAMSGLLLGLAAAISLGIRDRRGLPAAIATTLALLLASASVALTVQRSNVIAAAHESSNSLIRNSIGRGAQSSSERAALRQETYALWRSSDLIGSGPSSTKNLLLAEQAPYPKEAHNDWLATMVERGVLGGLGLLLLVIELAMRAQRVSARTRLDAQLHAVLLRPAHLTGGLVCVLAFSITHEVLHDRTVWTLFGLVAAVAFMSGRGTAIERGVLT
jgi:O-antigen ligase